MNNSKTSSNTVLDMDNLHFSEEFLEFPVRVDTRISTRTHSDFTHDTARKNLDRNSTRIRAENGESHLCREVASEAEPGLLRLQRNT